MIFQTAYVLFTPHLHWLYIIIISSSNNNYYLVITISSISIYRIFTAQNSLQKAVFQCGCCLGKKRWFCPFFLLYLHLTFSRYLIKWRLLLLFFNAAWCQQKNPKENTSRHTHTHTSTAHFSTATCQHSLLQSRLRHLTPVLLLLVGRRRLALEPWAHKATRRIRSWLINEHEVLRPPRPHLLPGRTRLPVPPPCSAGSRAQ